MKDYLKKLKEYFKKIFETCGEEEQIEEIDNTKEMKEKKKRYITREEAIAIADKEKNLKKSIYKEVRMRGERYGLVEIYDYYATLVIYNKKYAWYVKVMDGKYGYKQDGEYYTGKLKDKSNIRCLVMADTGEYIYIDALFHTKQIRMVNDDEYLDYINHICG